MRPLCRDGNLLPPRETIKNTPDSASQMHLPPHARNMASQGLFCQRLICRMGSELAYQIGIDTEIWWVITQASRNVNGPSGAGRKSASAASSAMPVIATPGRPVPVISRPL